MQGGDTLFAPPTWRPLTKFEPTNRCHRHWKYWRKLESLVASVTPEDLAASADRVMGSSRGARGLDGPSILCSELTSRYSNDATKLVCFNQAKVYVDGILSLAMGSLYQPFDEWLQPYISTRRARVCIFWNCSDAESCISNLGGQWVSTPFSRDGRPWSWLDLGFN